MAKTPKLVELVKHIDEEGKMAALTKALGDEVNYKKEDPDLAIVQVQTELRPPESGANPNQTGGQIPPGKPGQVPGANETGSSEGGENLEVNENYQVPELERRLPEIVAEVWDLSRTQRGLNYVAKEVKENYGTSLTSSPRPFTRLGATQTGTPRPSRRS